MVIVEMRPGRPEHGGGPAARDVGAAGGRGRGAGHIRARDGAPPIQPSNGAEQTNRDGGPRKGSLIMKTNDKRSPQIGDRI